METYQTTLDDLDAVAVELDGEVDTSEVAALMRDRVAELERILSELQTTGALTVDVPGAGQVTLGETELRLLDRMVLANITGLAAAVNGQGAPKASEPHPMTGQGVPPKTERQRVDEGVQDVVVAINQGFAAGSALLGMVSIGLSVAAFTAAAPAAAVAATAGLGVAFLAGAYSFATAAVSHQMIRGNRNADATSFNAGQQAAAGLVDVGLEAAGALPGPVGGVASGVNLLRTTRSTADALQEAQCRSPGAPQRLPVFDEFCSGSEVDEVGEVDDADGGPLCFELCLYAGDGECDDGGLGSITSLCELGTDCTDCGARDGSGTDDDPPDDGGTTEATGYRLYTVMQIHTGQIEVLPEGSENEMLRLCDFEGGGRDCSILADLQLLSDVYATKDEAVQTLCPRVVELKILPLGVGPGIYFGQGDQSSFDSWTFISYEVYYSLLGCPH